MVVATLAVALAAAPAHAQYEPKTMMGDGYKDRTLAANRWEVKTWTISLSGMTADDMAFYRAAILAKAAGFSHVKIVKGRFTIVIAGGMSRRRGEIIAVGTNSAADIIPCEDRKRNENCTFLSVDSTIALLAPRLEQTPADVARDLAQTREAGRRKD
ncbi:MAG: hypothetical protein V4574_02630 [Pseudomonadota bacterium]